MKPPPANQPTWHSLAVEEVFRALNASTKGLTEKMSRERLASYGPNELQAGHKVSAWHILLDQFKNVLLLILIIATGLSIAMGHGTEAIVIGVIVFFAVALGFYQEYRAERAMEALQQMAAPNATVIRNGVEVPIPARDLVPGDVVLLKAGNKVPADCRLTDSYNLQADEAPLTIEMPARRSEPNWRQLQSTPMSDVTPRSVAKK